jgi:hypothetical protein
MGGLLGVIAIHLHGDEGTGTTTAHQQCNATTLLNFCDGLVELFG